LDATCDDRRDGCSCESPPSCLTLDELGFDLGALGAVACARVGADRIGTLGIRVVERLGGERERRPGLAGVAETNGRGVAGQMAEVVRGQLRLDLEIVDIHEAIVRAIEICRDETLVAVIWRKSLGTPPPRKITEVPRPPVIAVSIMSVASL